MLPHQTRSAGCESGERQHSCLAGEGYREQRLPSPGMPFVTWPHRRQSIGHGHTRCHQGPAAVTAVDNARLGPEPSQKPRVQHSGASRIPGHLLRLITPRTMESSQRLQRSFAPWKPPWECGWGVMERTSPTKRGVFPSLP